MFSFGFEHRRQTVQNQVGIKFADNANVKMLHSASFCYKRSIWTFFSMRETFSRVIRAGSVARQFAAPQATASARLRSKERPLAVANANPARAASPQPTVDLERSGVVQA